ncbi:MAG TPA: phage portal protein [Phycisphaerae bacterium]|nr:phage portal protein [Phycisphaerae bacterium]HUU60104.1 phage portal protein [Phycisphaerae bacterium]
MTKRVQAEDMNNLLECAFLGGGVSADVEKARSVGDEMRAKTDHARSQQLEESFERLAGGEFVQPVYNPQIWAHAPKMNTRLARCIRTFARNTVGLGWTIEPVKKLTKKTEEQERKEVAWQTDALREVLNYPNPRMPLTNVLYLMKVDEETTGNGYIEVVRNAAGRIVKLFHVPAVTVRRRMLKSEAQSAAATQGAQAVGPSQRVYGFIQIRGAQKRYFKEFGDGKAMDAVTGQWHDGTSAGVIPLERRATEIIHFSIYDPTSQYYGAPRYVPASTAIAGNRQSAIRNVAFFENDAVPRMALLVSGGRVTAESMQQIEDFIRGKARGPEHAHRVMVIQVEPTKVGFQQQGKVAVELKPLTVGVTEDASFQTYRSANDEEVREIFGLAPVFFSTENVNKASATVSREITNEQEFEPDRIDKEYTINQTIVNDILCALIWEQSDENKDGVIDLREAHKALRRKISVRFRFARMPLTDPMDTARMDQVYASLGAMTPNELREQIGKPPFPEDYYFGDKPLPIAMAELTAGLQLAIALNEEAMPPEQEGEGGPPGMGGAGAMPDAPTIPAAASAEDPFADAMSRPFSEGIAVEGLANGTPGRVTLGNRDKPDQARGAPTPPRIPQNVGLSIASELMADARKFASSGVAAKALLDHQRGRGSEDDEGDTDGA